MPKLHPDRIMPMVLQVFPSFKSTWDEHLPEWHGEPAGIFNDTTEFAQFIHQAYDDGDIALVKEGFDFIERLLREDDEDVRGITTVGILEVLQIRATHHSYGSAAFVPFLGPESQLAWRWIEKVWEGKESMMDVVRAEREAKDS